VTNADGTYVDGGPTADRGWLDTKSFKGLTNLFSGLNTAQIIQGFENAQVLINGATRSAPLWRDGYQDVVAIGNGGLLRELIETGFELVRVGATNPTGAAADGAWLEAVLEKDVVKVAGGLSQFVRGFEGTHTSSGYWNTHDYKIVFKSEGNDDRTQQEKDTDKAIGKLLEGATPIDKDGKPLKPGQKVSGPKNYDKPGDASVDFDNFADDLGKVPKIRSTNRGPVRVIDMPDGGSASEYPKSTSTEKPTISIEPSRGRGLGRIIKIRYPNGLRVNLHIPTQG
jgi:hypothetical protein